MAPTIYEIEDKLIHTRPSVTRGWRLRLPRSIDELYWSEWVSVSPYYFRPLQMRLPPTEFIVYSKESLEELPTKIRELVSIATTGVDSLCREYIDKVSAIEVVREILVVKGEKVTTVWTIINTPPFEDSVREPIYTAQLQILRSLEQVIPIDFYILNESELPSDEKLSDVIPSNARSIWRR